MTNAGIPASNRSQKSWAAPPWQPWRFEGPVRHRLRGVLLLIGWSREPEKCDTEARRLVANGRSRIGRLPARFRSQRSDLLVRDRRVRRVRGQVFLPGRLHQLYCSRLCKWRAHKINGPRTFLRRCSRCSAAFETTQPNKIFCGSTCRKAAVLERVAAARVIRPCGWCGIQIPLERQANARYCCREHGLAAARVVALANLKAKRRAARIATLNGHANGHATTGDESAANGRSTDPAIHRRSRRSPWSSGWSARKAPETRTNALREAKRRSEREMSPRPTRSRRNEPARGSRTAEDVRTSLISKGPVVADERIRT